MSRILSGIRPSGQLHLGNYLGAIKQWIDLQARHEVFYMVADLHAITTPFDAKKLPDQVRDTVLDYLAAGLDPKKAVIFVQSHVPAHSQLMWLLNVITPFGELNRMTQWKEKTQVIKSDKEYLGELIDPIIKKLNSLGLTYNQVVQLKDDLLKPVATTGYFNAMGRVPAGLLNYPILQAADILAYKPDAVPVGDDQDQHVELSRDLAKKFNRLFGQTFPEPKSMHTSGKRIMDLVNPEVKMSKSLGGGIGLNDAPEEIENRMKKAVSSAEPRVIREAFTAAEKGAKAGEAPWKGDPNMLKQFHGVRNLFTILLALGAKEDTAVWKSAATDGSLQFSKFKPALSKIIADHFEPFRERRAELAKDIAFVDNVIADGNKRANVVAQATLEEVQAKMGLR